jgi:DNA modification methylase
MLQRCARCGAEREDLQIGLEPTPEAYVGAIVEVFSEVRRVLRDDGTLWLNLGDCYITHPRGPGGAKSSTLSGTPDSERRRERWNATPHPADRSLDPKVKGRNHSAAASRGCETELKHKDLVGIPWMVAFALRASGWWLRQDIVWHKPNPMPESIVDRCTKSHEYIFLLTKAERYYYDADAIAEPAVKGASGSTFTTGKTAVSGNGRVSQLDRQESETRNRRSVWTIPTQPTPDAHFATFPEKLVEPCVLAGSRVGDLVLDPFGGSGTVGRVAEDLGRRWILFDLNAAYAAIAARKTAQLGLLRLAGVD